MEFFFTLDGSMSLSLSLFLSHSLCPFNCQLTAFPQTDRQTLLMCVSIFAINFCYFFILVGMTSPLCLSLSFSTPVRQLRAFLQTDGQT
jgi:hypothetical protein